MMKLNIDAKRYGAFALRCAGGLLLLYVSVGLLLVAGSNDALIHYGTALMVGGFGLFLLYRALGGIGKKKQEDVSVEQAGAYVEGDSHLSEILREEEEF